MDSQKSRRTECQKGRRQAFVSDRRAASDQINQPAHQHHGAKRGDERIDAQISDDNAIDQPDRDAGRNAGDDPGQKAELNHGHGGETAGQCHGRSDRKIEAAADDHESHADGDNRHDR